MNVTESNAVTVLLDWLGAPTILPKRPSDDEAAAALALLAERSSKTLQLTLPDGGAALHTLTGRLAGAESDGAAQAVCQALARHRAKGGAIPWPSIERPFEEWQAAHERSEATG